MKITSISLYKLSIPFIRVVSHSLFSRLTTEALIAAVQADNGLVGYGEGTPRIYVTDETVEQSSLAAHGLGSQLSGLKIDSFAELKECLDTLFDSSQAISNPSATCALELALLDVWAQAAKIPLWQLFQPHSPRPNHIYSGILPIITDEPKLLETVALLKAYRFKFIKIKIATQEQGLEILRLIRRELGDGVDLRGDANCSFSPAEAIEFIRAAKPFALSALEQPVKKDDWLGLKTVTSHSSIPILADESVCTLEEAQSLIDQGACHGFNLKISKHGGILPSLKVWQMARAAGLICQIGSFVGETGILSAAGRHLATLCPEYAYLEGSLAKYVLTEDLVSEDLSFGPEGRAPILSSPGLGVSVATSKLRRCASPLWQI